MLFYWCYTRVYFEDPNKTQDMHFTLDIQRHFCITYHSFSMMDLSFDDPGCIPFLPDQRRTS